MAAIKMASMVLSIPGCETFSCSAIAIMAAATMRTSSQEILVPAPQLPSRSGIGNDERADYVQNQDVQETGHSFKRMSHRRALILIARFKQPEARLRVHVRVSHSSLD